MGALFVVSVIFLGDFFTNFILCSEAMEDIEFDRQELKNVMWLEDSFDKSQRLSAILPKAMSAKTKQYFDPNTFSQSRTKRKADLLTNDCKKAKSDLPLFISDFIKYFHIRKTIVIAHQDIGIEVAIQCLIQSKLKL